MADEKQLGDFDSFVVRPNDTIDGATEPPAPPDFVEKDNQGCKLLADIRWGARTFQRVIDTLFDRL